MGDALRLETITIEPAPAQYPNPLNQNFNNEVRLVGYEYSQRNLQIGESFEVTLYWEALPGLKDDYEIQVQLQNEYGDVFDRAYTAVVSGQYNGTDWQPGTILEDVHQISIDPGLPPGSYVIYAALIDSVTKEPQNIVGEDGHWINNHLLLARVNVR